MVIVIALSLFTPGFEPATSLSTLQRPNQYTMRSFHRVTGRNPYIDLVTECARLGALIEVL